MEELQWASELPGDSTPFCTVAVSIPWIGIARGFIPGLLLATDVPFHICHVIVLVYLAWCDWM